MLDLNEILMHACSNLAENEMAEEGWNVYNIETHCVGFRISARYNGDGTFEIRHYSLYDC